MIYVNLNIDNPFSDRWSTIFNKNGLLPKHKAWEFNGYRTNHLFNVGFKLNFFIFFMESYKKEEKYDRFDNNSNRKFWAGLYNISWILCKR